MKGFVPFDEEDDLNGLSLEDPKFGSELGSEKRELDSKPFFELPGVFGIWFKSLADAILPTDEEIDDRTSEFGGDILPISFVPARL